HCANCATIRVRLEVENFGLKKNLPEQCVDMVSFLVRDLARQSSSAVLLENDSVLQEILLDLSRICCRKIDFVDRDNHRHACILCVRDCFDGLRHHLIVSRNNEHDDISYLSTTCTHCCERFVTRRIEERDVLVARQRDVIRADVLSDST